MAGVSKLHEFNLHFSLQVNALAKTFQSTINRYLGYSDRWFSGALSLAAWTSYIDYSGRRAMYTQLFTAIVEAIKPYVAGISAVGFVSDDKIRVRSPDVNEDKADAEEFIAHGTALNVTRILMAFHFIGALAKEIDRATGTEGNLSTKAFNAVLASKDAVFDHLDTAKKGWKRNLQLLDNSISERVRAHFADHPYSSAQTPEDYIASLSVEGFFAEEVSELTPSIGKLKVAYCDDRVLAVPAKPTTFEQAVLHPQYAEVSKKVLALKETFMPGADKESLAVAWRPFFEARVLELMGASGDTGESKSPETK